MAEGEVIDWLYVPNIQDHRDRWVGWYLGNILLFKDLDADLF